MSYLIDVIYLVMLALLIAATAGGTRLITTDAITYRIRTWVVARYGENSLPGTGVYCNRCVAHYVAVPVTLDVGASAWTYSAGHPTWAAIVAFPMLILAVAYLAFRLLETEN